MLIPNPEDALHKAWLYRLLTAISDDAFLTKRLRFKGGTCAAMQDLIDRFSVDLDFDLIDTSDIKETRSHLEKIFDRLGLKIHDASKKVPQYFLKYPNKTKQRNTLELDITFLAPKSNEYEPVHFKEIDRILKCQNAPTMFANKLVSITDRFAKHGSLSGRDIFDIHTFFIKGLEYNKEVIKERTSLEAEIYLKKLHDFIKKHMTQTVIDQDLNTLLPKPTFQKIRGHLKNEVLMFLAQ
jgi:predicted nucleotidyltransferase component of viral defense system